MIRSSYDHSSEVYDSRYLETQMHKYAAFRLDFESSGSSIVLDVGGGTGLLARFVNLPIVNFDLSLGMLSKSRYDSVMNVAGDAENLPFRDGAIELVVSFSAVQNANHPEKAVDEILRVSSVLAIITALGKKLDIATLTASIEQRFEERNITTEDIGVVVYSSSSSNSKSS